MRNNERWHANLSFGPDAVVAVLGVGSDPHSAISDDQIVAIARASTVPYWTDGKRLWSNEWPAAEAGARKITALEALRAFSLEQLVDAREFGSTH